MTKNTVYKPSELASIHKLGPSGGLKGREYETPTIGINDKISRIGVHAGTYLDYIESTVVTPSGTTFVLPKHGGAIGQVENGAVALESDEFLIGISGRFFNLIDHITFTTNKRSHEFGGPAGEHNFFYQVGQDEHIVGFWGRAGSYIDAIGVLVAKRPKRR